MSVKSPQKHHLIQDQVDLLGMESLYTVQQVDSFLAESMNFLVVQRLSK